MSHPIAKHDIVIVGGGMVGASLAVALSDLSLNIALVEAAPFGTSAQPSYDERATAVSLGSQRIFESLRLWSDMSESATPIRQIHISDQGRFGFSRISADEQGVDALGYVVENRVIGAALWDKLSSLSKIRLYSPARLVAASADAETAQVEIACPEHRILTTGLLVAADGVRSVARSLLGVPAITWDYGQSAVVANVSTEKRHGYVAFERFTSEGPLAFLPMSSGRCNVVWTVSARREPHIRGLDDEMFAGALQDAFGFRLGQIGRVGERRSYSLALVRSARHTANRVAFVGNAAQGLHPIAGQGFNLGLRDIAGLGEAIADRMGSEADPGCAAVLETYAEWRQADQRRTVAFTDGLVRLFTSPLAPVKAARDLGLLSLDLLPGAKRILAKHSMGMMGRLPRLARGLSLSAHREPDAG